MKEYQAHFINFSRKKIDSLKDEFKDHEINKTDIVSALFYVFSGGGKSIRPVISYAVADAFSVPLSYVDNVAFALECIHTYSLIHDDLPAMDDDDIRRGKPSCHKRFNEATAILLGDALNTYAFLAISENPFSSDSEKLKQIKILSKYSGIHGMIGGQAIDLNLEGYSISNTEDELKKLKTLHKLKTSRLIQASILMPYILSKHFKNESRGKVTPEKSTYKMLDSLGENIGLLYQIQDDILDCTKSTEVLGKPSNSDEKTNKLTYVRLLGLDCAIKTANEIKGKIKQQISDCRLNNTNFARVILSLFERDY